MKALIKTQGPKTATKDIKKGYAVFEQRGVAMPDPLRLITASPGYFKIMMERNQYYSNHPALSFSLLAHIRYLVSCRLNYSFCRLFNKGMLTQMGLTESDFNQLAKNVEHALLEAHETKMLVFVLNAMEDPEAVSQTDVDELKAAGWTDGDILDALAQGVGMYDHSIFMRVFKPMHDD